MILRSLVKNDQVAVLVIPAVWRQVDMTLRFQLKEAHPKMYWTVDRSGQNILKPREACIIKYKYFICF